MIEFNGVRFYKIEKSIVELVENHKKIADFEDKFNCNEAIYGVKDSKPYINYKKLT